MNHLRCVLLVILIGCAGCAGTKESLPAPGGGAAPAPEDLSSWPEDVADVCPQRDVSQCCFQGTQIVEAMAGLTEKFGACYLPGAAPVSFELTVETRGGYASCVEQTAPEDETARCVAQVVARHLVIPGSGPEDRCRFRYPLRFTGP